MNAHLRSILVTATLSLAAAPAFVGCVAGGGADDGNVGYDPESVRCALGATVEGIDVADYQDKIDWGKVAGSGIAFGVARIDDGYYMDKRFAENWAGMKAAGMIRGAYQFFRPAEDPNKQADIAVAAVGKLGDGDLPVTLDMEAADGVGATTIAAHIKIWMDKVEAGTGKKPIIYTGKYFWEDDVRSSAFSGNALWIAQYGPVCPNLPGSWTNWTFFQYADHGTIPGIAGTGADRDRFNGSLADLVAFAKGDGSSAAGGSPSPAPSGSGPDAGSGSPDSGPTPDAGSATPDTGTGSPPDTGSGSTSDAGGTGGESDTGSTPTFQCWSATLGKEMPAHACVQSRYNSQWYECESIGWLLLSADTNPCEGKYPL